jgi:hypothetical protein
MSTPAAIPPKAGGTTGNATIGTASPMAIAPVPNRSPNSWTDIPLRKTNAPDAAISPANFATGGMW